MNDRIGVINKLKDEGPFFDSVLGFGLKTCQLSGWDSDLWTRDRAEMVRAEIESTGVLVTSFWAGWPGPRIWDFLQGPETLGIVPRVHRVARAEALKKAGEFARWIGLPAVITHLGFIPENPSDPEFNAIVEVVKDVALHLQDLGLSFWFETGQETPVTMLRLLENVGTSNLGLNLDPANLILYGKGSPVDSLDVFGSYVRNIHAKDGLYPTDPMKLGVEVKVGTGKVNFPVLLEKLGKLGFRGELIIEREISGKQQDEDIRETVKYLVNLLEDTEA